MSGFDLIKPSVNTDKINKGDTVFAVTLCLIQRFVNFKQLHSQKQKKRLPSRSWKFSLNLRPYFGKCSLVQIVLKEVGLVKYAQVRKT